MACPDVAFVPATCTTAQEAGRLLAEDERAGIDGYLVFLLGLWNRAPQTIAAAGKPTLFVDDLYGGSGEFLVAYSAARRAGQNVAGVSSSRFEDVTAAANCFATIRDPGAAARFAADCMRVVRANYAPPGDVTPAPGDSPPPFDVPAALKRLRDTAILLVGRPMQAIESTITEQFGTRVVPIDFPVLEAACARADPEQARAVADGWIAAAQAVVEPSRDEIVKSATMYLGMKALMAEHGADAITINCLGGFYGGSMSAYPCLGFCQLNDDGRVGACEADMKSTLTMLAMTYLVGRPGYISDPVIDTSKNQIIYAHCVAPSKVDGPSGPTNPVAIRNHSEDRKGASLRSLLPTGRLTTTLELDPAQKALILHQAKTVANIDEDKACRTKLAAEVKGDIDKLLGYWDQWGWHRVTYYGDLLDPVHALADAIGYGVVPEA
jgi:hypothetical protein